MNEDTKNNTDSFEDRFLAFFHQDKANGNTPSLIKASRPDESWLDKFKPKTTKRIPALSYVPSNARPSDVYQLPVEIWKIDERENCHFLQCKDCEGEAFSVISFKPIGHSENELTEIKVNIPRPNDSKYVWRSAE